MTRINCVPVHELTDKHLGAEYRELPRVFALAQAAYLRGERYDDPRNPTEYTLGKGHVRFFYPRLGYLTNRFYELVGECRARGRTVNFLQPPATSLPAEWYQAWQPTSTALSINRDRIQARLKEASR